MTRDMVQHIPNVTRYVNLGCGTRYRPDWINIDFVSTNPAVKAHNLLQGIPLADASCDVLYHSHVLEHFGPADGGRLLRECYRVLRPGGIMRVAVPDLEGIASAYLAALSRAQQDPRAWSDLHWMRLEMLDQMVRSRSGGEMAKYVLESDADKMKFPLKRCGSEIKRLLELRNAPAATATRGFFERHRLRRIFPAVRRRLLRLLQTSVERQAMALGQFRLGGEVHQWMYEHTSLSRALENASFKNPRRCNATESSIPDWRSFNLDTEPSGETYKPDSLFMEAEK